MQDKPMMFIDPHAHMISRTTEDYQAMAASGVVAVIEPAFWLGQPRTHVGSYIDYLSAIEEGRYVIAQANAPLNSKCVLEGDLISAPAKVDSVL